MRYLKEEAEIGRQLGWLLRSPILVQVIQPTLQLCLDQNTVAQFPSKSMHLTHRYGAHSKQPARHMAQRCHVLSRHHNEAPFTI